MSYLLHDVCTSRKDGSLHYVSAVNAGPGVLVDGAVRWDCPEVSSVKIAVDGTGRPWVLATGANEPALYVMSDGQRFTFNGPFGAGFGALRALDDGVEVYVMRPGHDQAFQTFVDVFAPSGQMLRSIPVPYQSTGIAQIGSDGSVLMDDQGAMREFAGGWCQMYSTRKVSAYTLGQWDGPGLALRKPDGSLWRTTWQGFTNQPSSIAVSADGQSVFVGIPGENTPAPSDVQWEPLTKPEQKLSDWPAAMPAIIVGCLSYADADKAPGQLGNSGSGKPVLIEGYQQANGARWLNADELPRQRLIYVDWKESHAKEAMLANAKADQDQFGGTLVFYFDSNRVSLESDTLIQAEQCKAEGRAVMLGLRCYPHLQKPAEMAAEVRSDIVAHGSGFPIALFAPVYKQAWAVIDARECVRHAARLAAEFPDHVKAIVLALWHRPPVSQDLDADAVELCRITPSAQVDHLVPLWTRSQARPAPAAPAPGTPVATPPTTTPPTTTTPSTTPPSTTLQPGVQTAGPATPVKPKTEPRVSIGPGGITFTFGKKKNR
jgi:hypothetical protein